MAVCWLGPWRGAGRGHGDADHHGKAQRGRPAGLAGRRAGSPAGSPRPADRRTPALDLGPSPADPECRLTSCPRNDPSCGPHRMLTEKAQSYAVVQNLASRLLDARATIEHVLRNAEREASEFRQLVSADQTSHLPVRKFSTAQAAGARHAGAFEVGTPEGSGPVAHL